jgi:hypothetical protein
MASDQTGRTLGIIGSLIVLISAVVAAAAYAVNANAAANAACRRMEELEPRVRLMEQTLPRIDERLSAIQVMLQRHEDDSKKGTRS